METATIQDDRGSIGEIVRLHGRWMRDEPSGSRCILENAALNELNLSGVDLQGAIFRGVTCIDAELSSIKLSRAVLHSSDFERAGMSRADFSEAQIFECQFVASWMAESSFCGRED